MLKFAAAAFLALGILSLLWLFDAPRGTGIAWADVIRNVENAQDFICHVQQTSTTDPDLEMVQYRSARYGYRADIYRKGRLVAAQYLKPSTNTLCALIHRDKTYLLVELTDEQRLIIAQSNAQEIIKEFRSPEFVEIGKRRIGTLYASGIEVRNPADSRMVFDQSVARLWVDEKTGLPVCMEFEGVAKRGKVRVSMVLDRFQWNPSLSAGDFDFQIPEDYRNIGRADAIQIDEVSAIEGLREFARLTGGSYPSSMSMATAVYEAGEEIERQRQNGRLAREAYNKFMKIQNTCAFYDELLKAGRDVEYHGGEVSSGDFDKLLLRWRLDGARYRVVYGDLRAETVSAERLAGLEERR